MSDTREQNLSEAGTRVRFDGHIREFTPKTFKGALMHMAAALYAIARALEDVAQAIREVRRG